MWGLKVKGLLPPEGCAVFGIHRFQGVRKFGVQGLGASGFYRGMQAGQTSYLKP